MRMKHKRYGTKQNRSLGFSMLEMLIVLAVSLIIAALTIPSFNQVRRILRISGDARDINGALNQAKMQAAADFTRARVYADFTVPNRGSFHVEVWNKALNGGNGCWQTVGDPIAGPPFVRCTVPGTSPVQTLSDQVIFGFGGAPGAPPNTQAGIAQAPACQNIAGGGGTIANTACVVFNSRGMPIIPGRGEIGVAVAPTGNDALYLTECIPTAGGCGSSVVYGMTVGPTGVTQLWQVGVNGGNWYHK
jgi:prepilin-type N-terminal cleavage/methylation domain-containing protein